MKKTLALILLLCTAASAQAQPPAGRWSEEKANAWYAAHPWLVGSNYAPATAINELEMWQADTFDPATIEKELGWAEGLGMTTMRVFLHDLLWQQDAEGYRARIDRFLEIAARHRIRPILVLFDSVWDPNPQLGPQRAPRPGVHNSGWLQSPGAKALSDKAQYPRLEAYVKGVIGAFATDSRVLAWDVWNEPDNTNDSSYGTEEPKRKAALVLKLLPKVFAWARAAGASQPLTSGVWRGDWSTTAKLSPMDRVQLDHSDVLSFHNYDGPAELEKRILWLRRYNRPLLCTEYMARGNGSTFKGSLPVLKKYRVGAINWGFVAGKTQTNLPWDSWQKPYVNGREPNVWFHEIFKGDGTPYRQEEVDLIRAMTGAAARDAAPVEEILVVRSMRQERAKASDFCAAAKAGFAGAVWEDRYLFRPVITRPADGRVAMADVGVAGSLHACFTAIAAGRPIEFFAEGALGEVRFTGRGQCAAPTIDFPEAGINALRCFLDLGNLPAGYVGGQLTTNSVISRAVTGQVSDPPGYTQPSIATVRLWKARPALAQPIMADGFGSHGVLQRDRPIRVFGQAVPGEAVTVSLDTASVTATTDRDGRWTATLPAMPAGGPYTLTAKTADGREQRADDVLVGDVWLCSGQSNMEMAVGRSLNGEWALRGAANHRIRLLQVPHAFSPVPLDRFSTPVSWKPASADTVAGFSGACYFFARELQKTVDVPMGLVNASWGGSNIQTWIPEAGLKAIGGFDDQIALLAEYARDPVAATARLGEAWQAWWRSQVNGTAGNEPWQPGAPGDWKPTPAALGSWKTWGVPALANHDGMVWYRRTVTLTKAQAQGTVTLALGGIDEVDETWVNGRPIANTFGWGTPRTYEVPAGLLHEGENTIVVNVLSTWDMGGLMGPVDAMKIAAGDGSAVPIGDAWQYLPVSKELGNPPRAPWESVGGVMSIGNAMIAPLGAYGLRGVAWYQGESNASVDNDYEALLAGLMAGWRSLFDAADLPFLVVQLPNFGAVVTAPVESGWASLREAQRRAVAKDAHAGLAVAIDVGEANELHPPDKQSVGARLARAARSVVYGEAITPSGPRPVSATRADGRITIELADVDGTLVVRSGARPNAFELCSASRASCRFADARVDGTRVVVEGPDVASATRVRYCWGDAPICTLYDRSGLPAGPFEIEIR